MSPSLLDLLSCSLTAIHQTHTHTPGKSGLWVPQTYPPPPSFIPECGLLRDSLVDKWVENLTPKKETWVQSLEDPLEWVAIPFSRGSSRSMDGTLICCNGRQILYFLSHQGSLPSVLCDFKINDSFLVSNKEERGKLERTF